jgi:tryptophan-rich sensory protein
MAAKNLSFALKVVLCIVAAELIGGVGGFVTSGAIGGWYQYLDKPPGTPPNWLFGPVWAALYAMMGLSFAIVWHAGGFTGSDGKRPLTLFVLQMVLNVVWTPVFFGLHQMLAALVIILLLWITILATILAFAKWSKLAAYLLVPYLLWVSYATYLNAGYWWLNH